MIDMSLSEDVLKQMGIFKEGTHSASFDKDGTLHVTYESQDGEESDVALFKDDGLLKTVDSTKEEDGLKNDIAELQRINKRTRMLTFTVLGLLVLSMSLAATAFLIMR